VADRSKARNLAELLSTKDLYPKGKIPEEVIRRLDELRGLITRAERELNRADNRQTTEGDGSMPSGSVLRQPSSPSAADNLGIIKQDMVRLILEEIQPIDPSFSLGQVQPLSIEQLCTILPDERTTLVSWYVAGPNLLAFILVKGSSKPLCHLYPERTLNLLTKELNSYFSTYVSNRSAWISGLPETLSRLSTLLEMDSLADQISLIAPQADQLIDQYLIIIGFKQVFKVECFVNRTVSRDHLFR
jgi:hypothetical protein